jgi:DNA-nicking Smr family endonuclease
MNAHDDRRRGLSADERALWGAFTQSVRPRAGAHSAASPREARATRQAPSTRQPASARKVPHPVGAIERRQKRRLARGIEAIDARLDLHGKTQAQAHAALLRFVRRAHNDGARFILVITGKGAPGRDHASGRGVLRRLVPLWLGEVELRGFVSAFEPAQVAHGGEGALYVRLRRKARAD